MLVRKNACLCAFHCLCSLCMPPCISLRTFPTHACVHFTVYFPCACLHAFHCLPYACLYAFHCLLSFCMPPCISLCSFPTHASMHFTVYFACHCPFPTHASMHFTDYFPYAGIYAHRSVISPLCISLSIVLVSTFPTQLSFSAHAYIPYAVDAVDLRRTQ